ncbi:UDP-glucose 4-epimerase [Fulvivirga imtechensis AK7]|uniref:UDP-glucose 4-epimerase n=1 Tax=Fulvivirga imtechensis AK7 TaxID=1237149 RepID=L8JW45_9BACT|nr:UDP-glucose 4-epimerase GalE [Fulvivirga imtechensis]ELR71457.1 UDP-glucose 4-epimerase [Fulvivirga imtechensis AK7]
MQKGKILVTGGAGYIGSHTCVELVSAGYTPIIVDNFSNSEKFVIQNLEKLTVTRVEVEEGDCNDYFFLKDVFEKHREIKGVIHFAAFKAVGESSQYPLKYYHNNVQSTVNLLQVMDEFKLSNLVFSSSCTVYGQPDILPVTESSPVKPAESPYGRTKQICEDIISDFYKASEAFKAISLRYFNPIGAHPTGLIGELPLGVPNNLVPFITQTAAGVREQLTIFGDDYNTSDGTCIRDYIHVVDLAKAHIAALEKMIKSNKTKHLEVYNIGTGDGHSVLEVVKTFEKVSGEKLNYKIGARRSGDVEKVFADVSKAKDELGWKTELSLEDSLRDAWNWQQKLAEKAI